LAQEICLSAAPAPVVVHIAGMPSRQSGVVALTSQDDNSSDVGSAAGGLSARSGSKSASSTLRSVKTSVTALVPGILTARWSRPRSARRGSKDGASVCDEEEIFINMLAKATFERSLSEEEVMAVLATCPEVAWLAECSRRMPLPEGWCKLQAKSSNPRPRFQCEKTGGVSDTPPHFQHFVHLAKLITYARQSPAEAATAREHVQATIRTVNSDMEELAKAWSGPHLDPDTGAQYYYCPATEVSTWENPFQGEMFLACVAERLLDSCAFKTETPAGESAEAGLASAGDMSSARQSRNTAAGVKRSGVAKAAANDRGAACTTGATGAPAAEGESDAWAALDDLIEIGYKPTEKPPTEQAWDAVSQLLAAQTAPGAKNLETSKPAAAAARPAIAPAPGAAAPSPATAPSAAAQTAAVVPSAAAPAAVTAAAAAAADLRPAADMAATAAVNPQEADAAAEVRALRSTVMRLEQQVADLQSKGQATGPPTEGAKGVSPEDMAALWQAMAALDARVHQKGANVETTSKENICRNDATHQAMAPTSKVPSTLPRADAPRSELDRVLSPRRRDIDQRAELFEGGAGPGAKAAGGYQTLKQLPKAPKGLAAGTR